MGSRMVNFAIVSVVFIINFRIFNESKRLNYTLCRSDQQVMTPDKGVVASLSSGSPFGSLDNNVKRLD